MGVNIWLVLLIAMLVMFAGLRTTMNDTYNYMVGYQGISGTIDALRSIEWTLAERPLFKAYQIVLKIYVSKNSQVLIFISALITETSMVYYLYRYSKSFVASVFLFLSFAVFALTMAAVKQTLATAIAIWSIPAFVRRKPVRAFATIATAMLVHPYAVVFGCGYFLCNRGVWNSTIYTALFLTALASLFFARFADGILSLSESIGDGYDSAWLESGTGVNRLRVVAYSVIPVLSYYVRRESPESTDAFQDACMNLTIIAACLSFLSGFGGSGLLGRVPNYFNPFICISFANLLHEREYFKSNKNLIASLLVIAFLIYYTRYYHKYYVGFADPWTVDIYGRITFSQLLRNW